MDIELRPIDERTIGVDLEVPQHGGRLAPQYRDGAYGDVQHPMPRPADEQHFPGEAGVDDAAAAAVRPESGADAPEQLGHLRSLQVVDLDHVKAVLRPDVRRPHPLGDLIGMRGWLREEQVEGPRDHGLDPRVSQHEVVVVRVGEHNGLEPLGVPEHFVRRDGMPQLMDHREPGQALVALGGTSVSVGDARRSRVEAHEGSLQRFCSHLFTFASHSASSCTRFSFTFLAISRSTFDLGLSPHSSSNICASPSANLTLSSHSPSRLTWKCGGSWSFDQNQHDRPGISKHATLGTDLPPPLTVYAATGHFSMEMKQNMSGQGAAGSLFVHNQPATSRPRRSIATNSG